MNQIETGKFIAACRKEKGMTQAQLAEKLNITDRAVSKWETGKSMPDSSIMLELCNILFKCCTVKIVEIETEVLSYHDVLVASCVLSVLALSLDSKSYLYLIACIERAETEDR